MKKLILMLTIFGTIIGASCSRKTYSDMYYDPHRGTEEPEYHGGHENLNNADHLMQESRNSYDPPRDEPTINVPATGNE